MDSYKVRKLKSVPDICVEVPGSKSITNRALLMAAMSDGKTMLDGVQFSADSTHFLEALKSLGFNVDIDMDRCHVEIDGCRGKIPKDEAEIYVGSAGTAARFLTAFVAMGDGIYKVDSSEQMRKRPMKELFAALEDMGARFEWLGEEYTFPVKVYSIGHNISDGSIDREDTKYANINLNIDRSSQFLSALLMVSPVRFERTGIHLTGKRSARSYVAMTEQMMKQFGHSGVVKIDNDTYEVVKEQYHARAYQIEPDVSAACYFYAMAAITGGRAKVKHMAKDSLQGDMKFIDLLEKMGCTINWTDTLELTGPAKGKLKGVDINMSDYSDQVLTLAAIAPYASDRTVISGVAHIRGQESDRLSVISTELTKMGIKCEEKEDGIIIYPGMPKASKVNTYNDHRAAMSFAVTGLMTDGIEILDPSCCSKTFAEYFDVLDSIERQV